MVSDAGRRALVTGAAGGIGGATVAELRSRGMIVVGLDRRAGEDVLACEVTEADSVDEAVVEACRRLGGLDVVVNIAGVSGRALGDGPVHECTDDAWRHVLDVNARSVFLVCRAAIPRLGRGASIVNVGSVLGVVGDASGRFATHAYAASKGAVLALTRAMAATYAADGIRVNAVVPGLVRTAMSARAQDDAEVLSLAGARQPLTGPLLEPTAVAATIGFLASVTSEGITGAHLPVDGGWLAT